MTLNQYLYDTEETRRKRELHFGRISEPPAPYFTHQELVLRIARLLGGHVDARRLGRVAVAPVDVVLDAERALIVQPDVVFIAESRTSIIRNQVWGPPDLVVEVLSSNHLFDRRQKLQWYGDYGVRECWLIDSENLQVFLVDLTVHPWTEQMSKGSDVIRSTVLPELQTSAFGIFLA